MLLLVASPTSLGAFDCPLPVRRAVVAAAPTKSMSHSASLRFVPTDVITPQLRPPLVIAAFVALSSSPSNGNEQSPSREYVVVVIAPAEVVVPAPIPSLCTAWPSRGRRPVPIAVITSQLRPPLVITAYVAISRAHTATAASARRVASTSSL